MSNHHHTPNDRDAGLEAFLHLLDPDIALPELSVEPEEINPQLEFGETRDIPVVIRNLGRGYLHGTIEVSDPNQAFELSTNRFFIDSKSEEEVIIQLRIDTNRLEAGRSYQTTLVLSSNSSAGQTIIPVSVLAVDYKKIARERAERALSIIGITAFLACVLIALLFFPFRYNNAKSIMEEGRFEEASILFLELGSFRDSEKLYIQNKYHHALELFKSGNYADAASTFKMLGDYKDSEEMTIHASLLAGGVEYYIDYTSGDIPIGELPIGTKVVDPSWVWEFRTGRYYTSKTGDDTKPVTWIVVAKDHYDGLEPHVTLLTNELIGKHAYDNSTNRGSQDGSNHWGESGTADATHGLRPWLNSSGIHSGEGFYQAFSESFRGVVLATTVPNKEWEKGTAYNTKDYVFIPSTTELGDNDHNRTYPIGSVYPYFTEDANAKRAALFGSENLWYWTRSPDTYVSSDVRYVSRIGRFNIDYYDGNVNNDFYGVRPALNLKSDTLVSNIEKLSF